MPVKTTSYLEQLEETVERYQKVVEFMMKVLSDIKPTEENLLSIHNDLIDFTKTTLDDALYFRSPTKGSEELTKQSKDLFHQKKMERIKQLLDNFYIFSMKSMEEKRSLLEAKIEREFTYK